MADRYYSNTDEGQRFQPGTTVRAEQVDGKLDEVTAGFQDVAQDVDRGIKLPTEAGVSQELSANALQRRNRVVGFDIDGNLALLRGFTWRSDWTTATEYFVNEVFRDPATKNLYVVNVRHTSGTLATDITAGRVELAISVEELEQLKADTQQIKDDAVSETTAIKNQAESARDASQSARDDSILARNASQSARDTALTHRNDAQAARDASQDARNESQAARNTTLNYRDTAEQHKNAAASSAGSAATAAGAAQDARDKAQQWAEAEGEVEPGERSAKYWAGEAASSVADGVIDDSAVAPDKTYSSQKIENEFARTEDLGTAAYRAVGTEAGELMEAWAFGLGVPYDVDNPSVIANDPGLNDPNIPSGLHYFGGAVLGRPAEWSGGGGSLLVIREWSGNGGQARYYAHDRSGEVFRRQVTAGAGGSWQKLLHSGHRAPIQAYDVAALAATSTLNLAQAQSFRVNVTTSNRTLSFTNAPGVDRSMTVVVRVAGNSGTVTWPSGISWSGGSAPTLFNNWTVVTLFWGGLSWHGFLSGGRD